tara:strand:+ start:412 stop:513 length:102 start_codon:yes stop_codon:yes gene_type:complete
MPDHIKELLKEFDANRLEEIANILIDMAIANIK